jgi:hypothetical protein
MRDAFCVIVVALLGGCATPSEGEDLSNFDKDMSGMSQDKDMSGVSEDMTGAVSNDMTAALDMGAPKPDLAMPPDMTKVPIVSQVWIIYDANAVRADVEGEMDCLINHTNFNDIVNSFNSSPFGGLRVQWAPGNRHGGSLVTSSVGQCGQLFGPDAQCLVNLVRNDPNLGVPANGDVFLYVLHDGSVQCGGGNNNGATGGNGEKVQGPNGPIFVYTGTIADGHGYNPCQQRVAMHELFEAVTMVSAADCCTGQTPGNFGDDCSQDCAQYTGVGPAGYGSYTMACPNGQSYTGQLVEKWSSGVYSPWQPSGCTKSQ